MKTITTQKSTVTKETSLIINLVLYAGAFIAGLIPFHMISNIFLAEAAFTVFATAVIFIATCIYPDTSLYDPYWSVAPVVMLLAGMLKYHFWNLNALLVLLVTLVWSIRLTGNWCLWMPHS